MIFIPSLFSPRLCGRGGPSACSSRPGEDQKRRGRGRGAAQSRRLAVGREGKTAPPPQKNNTPNWQGRDSNRLLLLLLPRTASARGRRRKVRGGCSILSPCPVPAAGRSLPAVQRRRWSCLGTGAGKGPAPSQDRSVHAWEVAAGLGVLQLLGTTREHG